MKNTTFFRTWSPKGCSVSSGCYSSLSIQQRTLSEQEMLDLQLQEQAARQQAQAYARQQQQQPLQVPLQVQQQVPLGGVNQVKNKRFIRLYVLMILLFSRVLPCFSRDSSRCC